MRYATFDGISYDGYVVNMSVKNEDREICDVLDVLADFAAEERV